MPKSRKQAIEAIQPSSRSNAGGNHEDWEQIQDAKERKKIQNRIAQRSYRTCTRAFAHLQGMLRLRQRRSIDIDGD